jgi:hypothetical protein
MRERGSVILLIDQLDIEGAYCTLTNTVKNTPKRLRYLTDRPIGNVTGAYCTHTNTVKKARRGKCRSKITLPV